MNWRSELLLSIVAAYAGLGFCGWSQDVASVPNSVGMVSFTVSDSFGETLRQYRLSITEGGGNRARSWVLDGKTGPIKLPFGEYDLRATASLCAPFTRRFCVKGPETLVTVGLTRLGGSQISGEGTPLHASVEGKVIGATASPDARLWVRLYSLFGMFTDEAGVELNGDFKLKSVPNGAYFIVLFRGTQVLTQAMIAPHDVTGRDRTVLLKVAR